MGRRKNIVEQEKCKMITHGPNRQKEVHSFKEPLGAALAPTIVIVFTNSSDKSYDFADKRTWEATAAPLVTML